MNSNQKQTEALICYTVSKGEDTYFTHVVFPLNIPSIESITIINVYPGSAMLEVIISNPSSSDQARQVAEKFLPTILDKIAYFYNLRIGQPQLGCIILKAIQDDGSREEIDRILTNTNNHQEHITDYHSLPHSQLIDLLNSPPNSRKDLYYKQYRIALHSDDPLAQYMLLYSILIQLFQDSQHKVDEFIREVEPEVQIFKKNIQKREKTHMKEETIYTNLRNAIAHAQPAATFEEPLKAIQENLGRLRALTQQAIETRIPG